MLYKERHLVRSKIVPSFLMARPASQTRRPEGSLSGFLLLRSFSGIVALKSCGAGLCIVYQLIRKKGHVVPLFIILAAFPSTKP